MAMDLKALFESIVLSDLDDTACVSEAGLVMRSLTTRSVTPLPSRVYVHSKRAQLTSFESVRRFKDLWRATPTS